MKIAGLLVAGLLLVAGCAAPSGSSGSPGTGATPQSNVDVDTPELRAQKEEAGVESCEPGQTAYDGPDPLPALTLPCLGGGPEVTLDELRGPLVINLFAQWCGPCRDELPFYQRLHEEGKGKVRVLGIDWLDTQPGGALALAADTGVTFPLLADPSGSLRQPLKIVGLPGVVLVDEDGRVTQVEYTVIREYDELTDLVAQHLDVTV